MHIWFLTGMMTSVGMSFGLILELLPSHLASTLIYSRLRTCIFWMGSLCIFSPWLVICCYFFHAATQSDSNIPHFVYAAFLGTLLMFITFGANSYLHHIKGKYRFPTAELLYVCLSFTAKTFLAADVFGGLKAQSSNDASS